MPRPSVPSVPLDVLHRSMAARGAMSPHLGIGMALGTSPSPSLACTIMSGALALVPPPPVLPRRHRGWCSGRPGSGAPACCGESGPPFV